MSTRTKAIIETTTGLFLLFGYTWWIHPLYTSWPRVVAYSAFLGLLIYSRYSRRESWHDIGFRWDNFIASGKIVFSVTLISLFLITTIWRLFFPINSQFFKDHLFWQKLLDYPFWALFQQYIVLAFFFRRFKEVFSPHNWIAILLTGLIFSLIHLPTPPLVIFCFIGGLFWTWTYHKFPNLFTIALSHAVLGACCSSILFVYMNVGPFADLGRWTKDRVVHYAIDSVNNVTYSKKNRTVTVSKTQKTIPVEGWVAPIERNIEKIYIRLGNKNYLTTYGREQRKVENYYQNPNYRYTGFFTEIPVSSLKPGFHMLHLKVIVKDRWFPHHPTQRIWVKIQA